MTGAAVVGAGASVYGVMQAGEAQDAASAQQGAALASSERIAGEQMDWQKEQQAQWDSMYGPVEANLSEYYSNLTPERFTAMGVQSTAQSFQGLQEQLKESLAQRGISGSGIEAQGITDLTIAQAQREADIRASAPEAVAQQQQGFLQLGLNQKAGLQAGMQNAFGQQQGVQRNAFSAASNLYNQAVGDEQSSYAALGQNVNTLGQVYGTATQMSEFNKIKSANEAQNNINANTSILR